MTKINAYKKKIIFNYFLYFLHAKIYNNSNMTQACWNCGYSFTIHLPTCVSSTLWLTLLQIDKKNIHIHCFDFLEIGSCILGLIECINWGGVFGKACSWEWILVLHEIGLWAQNKVNVPNSHSIHFVPTYGKMGNTISAR